MRSNESAAASTKVVGAAAKISGVLHRMLTGKQRKTRLMKPRSSDKKYKMTSWKRWEIREDFRTTQTENTK